MAKRIQKLNPLQVLNRLLDTIQTTDNIIEIFAEADQLIRQMIRCDQIYFLLNNDQARHFYIDHALNFGDREAAEDLIIPYNSTGLTELLQSGRSLRRHDLSGRGKMTPGDLQLLPPGTLSDLSVPILDKHKVLAIINLSSHQPHFFTKAQQLFAEQVALLLGFAMARSRLLEKLTATQTELSEWENKLACVTRNMQEAMVIIRPDYDLIDDANPAFERLSGYSAYELQTMRLSTLHPQYAELVRPALTAESTNGQHTNRIQLTLLRQNGDAILVSLHLVRLSSPGPRLVYLFYHEITPPALAARDTQRQTAATEHLGATAPSAVASSWKEIEAIVTSPVDLIEKIQSILVVARRILPFDYAQFDLFDRSGENIRRFAMITERCRGLASEQSWQALPETDLYRSGIEEKALAQVLHEPARAIEKQMRSSIPLPLLVYDQYSGMLVLANLEPNCYLPAAIQLAEQIAQKIVQLIELEQSKDQPQPAVDAIEQQFAVLISMASSLSLEQVLEKIVQAAAGALHASLATVRLMEGGNPSRQAIFSRPELKPDLVTRFEKNIILPHLLLTEQPSVSATIGNGSLSREASALLDATTLRSYHSVPIETDQRVLAVLTIYWETPHPLSTMENRWLELLVQLSAQAIQNAQRQEALQRDNASIRHQQLALERFAKMATEAIGAALTNIQALHAALGEEFLPDINQQMHHWLQQMQCHAANAQCIARAWHEFSSLLRSPLSVEEINVAEIIKQAIHELRPKIVHRSIEIIIEQVLPVVYGDRHRLRQVFFHLIDWAISQIGEVTVRPKIEVGHRAIDGADQFFIRNNGPAAQHLHRKGQFQFFDCLYQNDQPPVNGTLVDLLIVQQIVEQHRGEIWFDSETETGNALYFTLPRD